MNYIKSFSLFESNSELPNPILIEEFIDQIFPSLDSDRRDKICNFWNIERDGIDIYYFNFKAHQPIVGVFLGETAIAINSKFSKDPEFALFIALHESRHIDQMLADDFENLYFNSVVKGNQSKFMKAYPRFERDANDFAINAMITLGFSKYINTHENRLRGNEHAANIVYKMMTADIERLNPINFKELLTKQILGIN